MNLDKPLTSMIRPESLAPDIKEYEHKGGYSALRKALKSMTPREIQKQVSESNLRGRGGAGFPTGLKWSFIPMGAAARRPKYVIVNSDEMEPGTFKDRLLMEGNPHQMIEGTILTAYAVEAEQGYIFIRWAYKKAAELIKRSIDEAYKAGFLGKDILGSGFCFDLDLHESSGRYMCGEETGMLNALEGKRAIPRSKPPYPQVSGLFGNPTAINNVETICNIPHIVNNGAEWFRNLSRAKDGGTKLFGVSGKVKNPGLWELPMGTTAREIFDLSGGMLEDYNLRGFQPGGASTEFLSGDKLDITMDFESVQKAGSRLGTGTMIILDDKTCPVGMVQNLEAFFSRESCGWCTPCRDGLPWAEKILWALENGGGHQDDIELLRQICFMTAPGHTFCAFAPGAAEPLLSALDLYRDDFENHIREHECRYRRLR